MADPIVWVASRAAVPPGYILSGNARPTTVRHVAGDGTKVYDWKYEATKDYKGAGSITERRKRAFAEMNALGIPIPPDSLKYISQRDQTEYQQEQTYVTSEQFTEDLYQIDPAEVDTTSDKLLMWESQLSTGQRAVVGLAIVGILAAVGYWSWKEFVE